MSQSLCFLYTLLFKAVLFTQEIIDTLLPEGFPWLIFQNCVVFFSEIWLGWFVEIDDKLENMSDYREKYNYKEISFITNSFLKVMQILQIPSSVAFRDFKIQRRDGNENVA